MINDNLLAFEVSDDSSGRYQCIDRVENITLLHYSFTVNAAASLRK